MARPKKVILEEVTLEEALIEESILEENNEVKIEEIKTAIKGMTLTSPKFESFPAKELIHSIRVESDCTKFLVRISLNKSNPHHLSITPRGIIKQLQRNHPKLGNFVKIK